MKPGAFLFFVLAFSLSWSTLSLADSTTSDRQVENAIDWYGQYRKIPRDQVSPEVVEFLGSFLSFLRREVPRSGDTLGEIGAESEIKLDLILKQYDNLIRASGPSEESRRLELEALSFAVQDPTTDEDDLLRVRFLQKFHKLIDVHYSQMTEKETSPVKSVADPIRVQTSEIFKTIGTYSIYGFFLNTAFYLMTGEYKIHNFFSEPVFMRMAIVAVASGPFSFFNQLFVQTYSRMLEHIHIWRERRPNRRGRGSPPVCGKVHL